MTSATRPRAGWATTPPAEPISESNERTVARCSDGMSAVDERLAERPCDREHERPGREQEQRDDEAAGQPEQDEQDDVEDAADQQGARPASEQAADPRDDEPADDLDPGDDRGGQAGDPVRGLVAVQLEQIGLGGVEHEDARRRT